MRPWLLVLLPVICLWIWILGRRFTPITLHFLLGWARPWLRISGRNFIDDSCNAAISFYAPTIWSLHLEKSPLEELLPLSRLINGKLKENRLSGTCYHTSTQFELESEIRLPGVCVSHGP